MTRPSPINQVIASVRKLSQMDPQDEAVAGTVEVLQGEVALSSLGRPPASPPRHLRGGQASAQDDTAFLKDQISKLHSAALHPAARYQRVLAILAGLHRAVQASERPQYASLRPRIAGIVHKVAGVFAEVDTVKDLDKDLAAIEKAVHGLYGDQSSNSTFYFDRRGKGHHSKSEGG